MQYFFFYANSTLLWRCELWWQMWCFIMFCCSIYTDNSVVHLQPHDSWPRSITVYLESNNVDHQFFLLTLPNTDQFSKFLSFTVKLAGNVAIQQSLNISPHLKCIITLAKIINKCNLSHIFAEKEWNSPSHCFCITITSDVQKASLPQYSAH